MVELWQQVVGVVGVLLGVAWVVAPVRMSHLQTRVLYLGYGEKIEGTEQQRTVGRVTGALLALLGAGLVLGVIPP